MHLPVHQDACSRATPCWAGVLFQLREGKGEPTWVPNEDGVVLGAPAQDANASADLLVSADDWVQLRRLGSEVRAVLLQRLEFLVRSVSVHAGSAAPHALQCIVKLALADACGSDCRLYTCSAIGTFTVWAQDLVCVASEARSFWCQECRANSFRSEGGAWEAYPLL